MYYRSRKTLILSVISLLVSVAMIWNTWPLISAENAKAPLGMLVISNFVYALLSISLLLAAWLSPKRIIQNVVGLLALAIFSLNFGVNYQTGLLKSEHWWSFVIIAILLSINVLAVKSAINESVVMPKDI